MLELALPRVFRSLFVAATVALVAFALLLSSVDTASAQRIRSKRARVHQSGRTSVTAVQTNTAVNNVDLRQTCSRRDVRRGLCNQVARGLSPTATNISTMTINASTTNRSTVNQNN